MTAKCNSVIHPHLEYLSEGSPQTIVVKAEVTSKVLHFRVKCTYTHTHTHTHTTCMTVHTLREDLMYVPSCFTYPSWTSITSVVLWRTLAGMSVGTFACINHHYITMTSSQSIYNTRYIQNFIWAAITSPFQVVGALHNHYITGKVLFLDPPISESCTVPVRIGGRGLCRI